MTVILERSVCLHGVRTMNRTDPFFPTSPSDLPSPCTILDPEVSVVTSRALPPSLTSRRQIPSSSTCSLHSGGDRRTPNTLTTAPIAPNAVVATIVHCSHVKSGTYGRYAKLATAPLSGGVHPGVERVGSPDSLPRGTQKDAAA